MGWLTNLFAPFTLNPGIAALGVGLIAAPIVIHLINRMRFRTVQFAAMEFLLASQQKNRRRVLIEQLLLLLLRILIVIGILLLIARLILDPSALAMIRSGMKTHHVVLLDDSGSMRSRTGETTAFDEAKQVVRRLVAEAAREPGSRQLTLILLSQAKNDEAFFTERDIDDDFLNELDTKLENVTCTYAAFDLADGLEAARRRLVPDRSGARMLHVLSDYRKTDWTDDPGLLSAVADLGKSDVSVNLVRVADGDPQNVAVTSLAGDLNAAAAGVPIRVRVGVTNFGTSVAEDVAIGVTQNKQKLPISERFAKIEPGSEVFADFDVTFQTPGRHSLRMELTGDALPADDRRHAAVDVAARHSVLIIDGTPGEHDAPGLLSDALAPIPGLSGLSPRIESIDFLRNNRLDEFRAIYLVNVPSLPVDAVRSLENYVTSGGGIAWFLGNAVQPEFYNTQLHRNPKTEAAATDGPASERVGLFPVPLARAKVSRTLPAESEANDITFEPVGRFAPFAGELGKHWRGAEVATLIPAAPEWVRSDDERADGVTTVARVLGGEPIIFRHTFGRGRVLTVLTSAGQSWTNWPRQFIYVPFLLESFKELASTTGGGASRVVGSPLAFRLPAADFDPEIRIERPDGTILPIRATLEAGESAANDATGERTPDANPLMLSAVYRGTDEPGIYKVLTAPVAGGLLQETWYAMNAPLAESQVRLADVESMRKQLAGVPNVTIRDPGDLSWLRVREAGREVRIVLIVLLIALLVAEQALAYRLSYHPKSRGALQWGAA